MAAILKKFGQVLSADVTSRGGGGGLYRDSRGAGESGRGGPRGHGEGEAEKLQEARGHEKGGRDRQRTRPHFPC